SACEVSQSTVMRGRPELVPRLAAMLRSGQEADEGSQPAGVLVLQAAASPGRSGSWRATRDEPLIAWVRYIRPPSNFDGFKNPSFNEPPGSRWAGTRALAHICDRVQTPS